MFLTSILIPSFISLGVYFLGKFIGKRFNFSEFSYLGFAIISFVLAFICLEENQTVILKIFVNYPFIDRRTILLAIVALCFIAIFSILFKAVRRETVSVGKVGKNQNLKKQVKIPKNLPEAQENILKHLATLSSNERLETDEIAEYIRLSPQKTQVLLDQLIEKRLVVKPGDSYVSDLFPKKYSLDDGGRIYLNNKGLL